MFSAKRALMGRPRSPSTHQDIDGASYDGVSVAVDLVNSNPFFDIVDSGNRLYVAYNSVIYGHTFSTPYDLSTLSAGTTATASAAGLGMRMHPSGTYLYLLEHTPDLIHQYALTTAWDITTLAATSTTMTCGAEETAPRAFHISEDGTKIYVQGSATDAVYQYNLTTAWDVTTASYSGKSLSTSAITGADNYIFTMSDDGMRLLVGSGSTAHQYNLTTAWDLATAYRALKTFYFGAQETSPRRIQYKPGGSKVYLAGFTNKTIYQYSL